MLIDDLGKAWREREADVPIEPRMTFQPEGLVLGAGTVLAGAADQGGPALSLEAEARLLALLSAAYGKAVGGGVSATSAAP